MNTLNLTLPAPSWLQTILNNTSDAVFIADPELHVIKWNLALEELLRRSASSIAGKNMMDLLRLLGCADYGISGKIQRVIENGFLEEEIHLIRPSGKVLQVSCYVHKFPETDQLSAIVVIIQDLKKQIGGNAAAINPYEFIYSSYLENSLAPAWVTDEDGYTVFMNDRARKIWGIDECYRFKNIYELFPTHTADSFIKSDKVVLETSQPLAFVIESKREDGSPGYFMLHKFLLLPNGGKRLVAGQAIDITAEKQAEEAVLKSAERFSYVTKAVSECIWDFDIEAGTIYRSEALMTLTGYTPEEINDSLDWWEIKTHPEDRKTSITKFRNYVKAGRSYCHAEYRFLCAGNKYRYFADKGYIIYKDGKPVRAIGVVQDITEQKKLEAKLLREKIQKEKEITRAVIAAQDHVSNELAKELHDNVNQILSIANLMLDCAQKHYEDNKDYIKKSKEYTLLAINEIRKISKSLNTSRIKEELFGPVEEIIANLRLSLSLDIQFEFDQEVEELLTHAQKLMLFRIIQEQTNNIIKYADATKVFIAVSKTDNSFRLIIKDNGKGFDLKAAKNGIGLTNIRNRVEAFSGLLNIAAFPGEGCSVEVTIPACTTC